MRAIIQRVSSAQVSVDGELVSSINQGLLVLLAVHESDQQEDIDYIVKKILTMRIFQDKDNKMNLSIEDIEGDILVVSQFTLYGDIRKGRRPSFSESAKADKAKSYYEAVIKKLSQTNLDVQSGIFAANMQVELINDGPVTIQIDSKKLY